MIKAALHQLTRYDYGRRITLSPQIVRLRSAPHSRTAVPDYSPKISPPEHSSIEVDGGAAQEAGVRRALVALLARWSAISSKTARRPLVQVCHAALTEEDLGGGVVVLLRHGQDVALSLRERFARDFWHIVCRRCRRSWTWATAATPRR